MFVPNFILFQKEALKIFYNWTLILKIPLPCMLNLTSEKYPRDQFFFFKFNMWVNI